MHLFFYLVLTIAFFSSAKVSADLPISIEGKMQCEIKHLSVTEASDGSVKEYSGFSDGLKTTDRFPMTYKYFEHVNFHDASSKHKNWGDGLRHHFQITSGRDNDVEFLTEGNKDPEPDVDAAYQIINSEPVVYGDAYRRFAQKDRIGLDFPDIFEVSRNEISFSGDGSKITLQRYFKNDWMLVFSDLPSTRGFPAYATLLIANCTHLTKATIDEIIERIFRIQPPKDYNHEEARIISNNSIHEPALSSWEEKEIDR